ncbi:MAG: inosine 5-monophosphate dehydrogenase [Elusimicrobia bacterium CG1_02_63_36]|nr:MAG: inosine 5-monophosphate dehydrogenase [Elusimicrobia bacterium CG1_02_63_36]PIP85077.1 MAG: GuaB3 family IMP dehydrogenase-related protein [Elusimicrobia bacterium CG22_combo_CG10-13_8_21_14_all_63_91]PJA18557.1 MAG: GuaB3 family IMP dehydrogenase-related protein [Elusimicrobia bacterium CG_4_10_14_0_2_um_filter_63_34]PJB23205.1 MAG: GuaB3 family IMP dehydrogenase-related protein [Elusimicrobia bacterium CG_4_9_14_3_um_filter_62_55]
MPTYIGRDREVRRCYGFDEIAIVPGNVTVNPEEVDTTVKIGNVELKIPFLASAMDGVVDTRFATAMGKAGGLGVLNLDGINTRYEKPREIVSRIASATPDEATQLVQELYKVEPKEELIGKRVAEIKESGVPCAVSTIPQNAAKYGPLAAAAGADLFFVQSTVTTVRHKTTRYEAFDIVKFCKEMKIPIVVGNTVGYDVSVELMEAGIAGLLVGVGPGAACTTRGVLGLGVPQVTATIDCAAARDFYFKKIGRYVPIITDGGMSTGGDICKAFACGADAVMVGSAFARTKEAPGQGYHWGMATPHSNLPRGTRVRVGVTGTLDEILFGPSRLDDGSQNLVGALKTCMGAVGAMNIKEMQLTEIIIAPSIKTEGKLFQRAQQIGMGKF